MGWPGQESEHETDHGDGHEGGDGSLDEGEGAARLP